MEYFFLSYLNEVRQGETGTAFEVTLNYSKLQDINQSELAVSICRLIVKPLQKLSLGTTSDLQKWMSRFMQFSRT